MIDVVRVRLVIFSVYATFIQLKIRRYAGKPGLYRRDGQSTPSSVRFPPKSRRRFGISIVLYAYIGIAIIELSCKGGGWKGAPLGEASSEVWPESECVGNGSLVGKVLNESGQDAFTLEFSL